MGGIFSERSGVVNIGLEGMMLVGRVFAVWGSIWSGSWVVGVLMAMISGGLLLRSSTRSSRSTSAPTRSSAASP